MSVSTAVSQTNHLSGGILVGSRICSQLGDIAGGDGICGLCFFLGRERGTPIPNNLSSSDPSPTSNSGCGLRFLFFRGFLFCFCRGIPFFVCFFRFGISFLCVSFLSVDLVFLYASELLQYFFKKVAATVFCCCVTLCFSSLATIEIPDANTENRAPQAREICPGRRPVFRVSHCIGFSSCQ